jgi:putative intracellular protease/amidase
MNYRTLLWGALGATAILALAGAGWIIMLPSGPTPKSPPAIAQEEVDATLAALKPPKRPRPLIAIIGINDATETADYLLPYGILRRADVADVLTVATGPGPVSLYPALKIEPNTTVNAFDGQHPKGADYVIVPAMSRDDDPAVMAWLKEQAAKGAIIIGICAGAKVVAAAGLLDGKQATTHWYFLKELRKKHPSIQYAEDRRLVVDGARVTTTGITASMPMMLTLVEAIAGRDKAEAVAKDLGIAEWDTRHDSSAFKLTRPFAATVLRNLFAFWNWEKLGIALSPGMDEVSLALMADAWSRTYRSRVVTFADKSEAHESRNGARILPDEVAGSWPPGYLVPAEAEQRPAEALEQALDVMATRYGPRTAAIVAMQLEYPRKQPEH